MVRQLTDLSETKPKIILWLFRATLKQSTDIRGSWSQDSFPYSLSFGGRALPEYCLCHSHPPLDPDCPSRALEQVSLSEQQGPGHWVLLWLKYLCCWYLCPPHPSPSLLQPQVLKRSRLSTAPDKHRTGKVAWTALMVVRLIKYTSNLGASWSLRNP